MKNRFYIRRTNNYDWSVRDLEDNHDFAWIARDWLGEDCAVYYLSWLQAVSLCRQLNKTHRLMTAKCHWQSCTMGNIVPTIWNVIAQVIESLFVYHTLDIKWEYSRNGF